MYARPARFAAPRSGRRGRYIGLSGQVVGGGCWMEGPNARGCMESWCENVDSQTGERVGEPYLEMEMCQTHVDAQSETVSVPLGPGMTEGTVTYQQRTEYVVPYGSTPPAPDSAGWESYVEQARQGAVYQNVVAASEGVGTGPLVWSPAGQYDPATGYVGGTDPRTGLPWEPGQGPRPEDAAPEWWEAIAYGDGGGELAPAAPRGVSPLLLAAGAAGLLFLVLPRRRRAA